MRNNILVAALLLGTAAAPSLWARSITLYNVSYDPTREFYRDIDEVFVREWDAKTGDDLLIRQSHGGSAKQAGSVIQGMPADVVTLGLAYDIDAIHDKASLLPADWQSRLPDNSAPYTSTIVFLVRNGNPKAIKDWDDLVRPGVHIIAPNPKTSGGARWAYLAAYGYALKKNGGDTNAATRFIDKFYQNVAALGAGARDSTTTFARNGIGDVLVSWENEALLARDAFGAGSMQIVYPSISILAEPPVAVVDVNAQKDGVLDVARAYLQFLYTPEGQEIAAKHYFRPRDKAVLARHRDIFPDVPVFTVDDTFGGWKKAQKIHFDEGGVFDQVFRDRR